MKKIFILAIVVSLLCISFIAFAQEGQQRQEEVDYSYGKIISLAADKIEVTEYDYDKNTEINVSYVLDQNVEVRNAVSLKDLSVGDNIEIDFVIKDDKKIAKLLTLEKDGDEELDSP